MLPLPTNIEETLDTLSTLQSLETSEKNQFLLFNDSEKNGAKFSCITNLQFFSSFDVLYVDKTFKPVPTLSHKLFTTHGLNNDHCVSLAFCLLANIQQTLYKDAFRQQQRLRNLA